MAQFNVDSTRRHTYRDGSVLRPALVRMAIHDIEPFIVPLDAVEARELAARLIAMADRVDAINRAGRLAGLRPADHEARHDHAAAEMCFG